MLILDACVLLLFITCYNFTVLKVMSTLVFLHNWRKGSKLQMVFHKRVVNSISHLSCGSLQLLRRYLVMNLVYHHFQLKVWNALPSEVELLTELNHLILWYGNVWLAIGTDSFVFTDDVTADKGSRINSEVFRTIFSAQIQSKFTSAVSVK